MKDEPHELDHYAENITSAHGKVPKRLLILYGVLPIWGIITFIIFWNGSWGWLDRGYWNQLQRAANTTYPYINTSSLRTPETISHDENFDSKTKKENS